MNNSEFVNFCYQKILRRNPDREGEAFYSNALESNYFTREEMLLHFLNCDEYKAKTAAQEFVPAGHFYSAIPSLEEREYFLSSNLEKSNLGGIDLNIQTQIDLLNKFKKYHDECPFPDYKTEQFRYYFVNPAYSYTDALTLYSMMRHFKPKKMIEIGSGFSSCVMLDTSDRFFDSQINLTFIEPYPDLLYSLINLADTKQVIIPQNLQQVDINVFRNLEEKDILFIDSTHVSKLNSDVNRIIFEILPLLQQGVIIHFHDIFWPFEYPKDWIREGRAWNEAYILRAFLEFNDSFEIIFFANYLHQYQHQYFQENMPLYLKNTGGNIWLRKTN